MARQGNGLAFLMRRATTSARDEGGQMPTRRVTWIAIIGTLLTTATIVSNAAKGQKDKRQKSTDPDPISNAMAKAEHGRQIFRFDTFGDQAFWGDTLKLHQAIEGAANGGVGPGVSPRTALTVGLKIDIDALPSDVVEKISKGRVNLDDPAVTLALLKLNAVVGLTGVFSPTGNLQSVGIQCALCHSSVDNSQPALCSGAITPNPGTGCI